ncbi:Enolase-phosphatase E1 [Tyrophagus putrescentiae]|nr:Enolase-phosphatase E1 [Tyrophagus putrescentiae]
MHCIDHKKDNEGMTLFRFHVIFDGYAKNRLETPLYTDVAVQMHHWVVEDKVKLYLFSNGWKEATKRYLEKTSKGDVNLLITDIFDAADEGPLTDSNTFKKIAHKIKLPPDEVLFLTHSGKEGLAAKKAGVGAILVKTHRRDVFKLSAEEKKALPYVRSFNEIVFTSSAPKAHKLDGSSVAEEEKEEKEKSKKTPSSSGLKKSTSGTSLKKKKSSKSSLSKKKSQSSLGPSSSGSSSSSGGGLTGATIEVRIIKLDHIGVGGGPKTASQSKSNDHIKSSSNGSAAPSKSASKLSNKSHKSVSGKSGSATHSMLGPAATGGSKTSLTSKTPSATSKAPSASSKAPSKTSPDLGGGGGSKTSLGGASKVASKASSPDAAAGKSSGGKSSAAPKSSKLPSASALASAGHSKTK